LPLVEVVPFVSPDVSGEDRCDPGVEEDAPGVGGTVWAEAFWLMVESKANEAARSQSFLHASLRIVVICFSG